MKKLLIAAVAASTLFSGTAMAAPYNGQNDRSRFERQDDRGRQQARQVRAKQVKHVQQVRYQSFRKGDRFDQRFARSYREIRNPRAYGMRYAPAGHRWVQSGNDALLVGITSGIVAAVIAGAL